MNRYTTITIFAIIVIAIPVLYGIWGIYSVEQIQLRTPNSEFRFFELSNYKEVEMCNPMAFFVSFNGLKIATYYANDLKGLFEIGPTTIYPNTTKILDGNFSSEVFSESQYLFMHMDWEFYGDYPVRLDPSKMVVVTDFETKIIGVIPYQTTITQSGFDFTKMMNEDSRCEDSD